MILPLQNSGVSKKTLISSDAVLLLPTSSIEDDGEEESNDDVDDGDFTSAVEDGPPNVSSRSL